MLWVGWFVNGLCEIIDGLCNTLTLCAWRPSLSLRWLFWIAEKQNVWVLRHRT